MQQNGDTIMKNESSIGKQITANYKNSVEQTSTVHWQKNLLPFRERINQAM